MDRASLGSLRNEGNPRLGYIYSARTKSEAVRNEEAMWKALGRQAIPLPLNTEL